MQHACLILLRNKYYPFILYEDNYRRVKEYMALQREGYKIDLVGPFGINISRWRYYRVPNSVLIQVV